MKMFEWSKNLNVAKELMQNDSEEYYRSAINRAYYAAFGTARTYLDNKRLQYDMHDGNIHKKVWDLFLFISKEIHVKGDRLRLARVKADYKGKAKIVKSIAKQAVSDADFIVKKIKEL